MSFIDIIIPVYNPKRIKSVFDSLENQVDKDIFNVIIVNDCGGSEFEELLPQYTFNYKVLTTPKNVGQGLARQYGIDSSDGEWITFLDHDDALTVNAISIVANDIKESGCTFMYNTQSIICNDENWIMTGLYQVEDSTCVLHGHFYNRKKLEQYNIKFSDRIRAQEDTYFIGLCNNHMFLDKDNFEPEKTVVQSEIITYIWYLWKDSQSHTDVEYAKGKKANYLENSMPEYVDAILSAFEETIHLYNRDLTFEQMRLYSVLMYVYWFLQAFEFRNPTLWKKDNLQVAKNLMNYVINFYNVDLECVIGQIYAMPDLFDVTYRTMQSNVDGMFIPNKTIRQFYEQLYIGE